MRKKEPPSPAMPAQQRCGPPLSQAARTEALGRKREALDREVAEFTARKEEEFRAYERRLSLSAAAPEDLKLNSRETEGNGSSNRSSRHGQSGGSAGLKVENVHGTTHPSPTTPLHDKERELQGLFLPHFIPLLDDPPVKRSTSPLKPPSNTELPAQRTEVISPDPSAYSPRTSPSPSLLASPTSPDAPAPESIDALLAPVDFGSRAATPTPSNTSSSNSEPVSPSAIPTHLRPSSRSSNSSHRQIDDTDSHNLLSPQSERPGIGTRTSSTQSDGSTTSLKSSLRRPTNFHHARTTSQHKKKHVRISIGNLAVAPSESPVQTRSAFKPPAYTENPDFVLSSSADGKGSELPDDRGRIEARDVKAGKARIDDEGGARRRRKKRAPTLGGISSGSQHKYKALVDEPLDYFPPQPLRSPNTIPLSPSKPNGRYAGTDLIQPTTPTTPPAFLEGQEEEFDDVDDPLFGGGAGKDSPRQGPQNDEDVFGDREDMEVVNGHDLVEEDEEDGLALPSPSPHASSMPMAIRNNSSSGWRMGGLAMGP